MVSFRDNLVMYKVTILYKAGDKNKSVVKLYMKTIARCFHVWLDNRLIFTPGFTHGVMGSESLKWPQAPRWWLVQACIPTHSSKISILYTKSQLPSDERSLHLRQFYACGHGEEKDFKAENDQKWLTSNENWKSACPNNVKQGK